MASSLTCKLYRGDEIRRFTLKPDEVTFENICRRVDELFVLTRGSYTLQYKDDENDLITMSTEDEMAEALALALSLPPPTLRLTVKSIQSKEEPQTKAPTPLPKSSEAPPTSSASKPTPTPSPSPGETAKPTPNISSVVQQIAQSLPEVLEQLPQTSPTDYCAMLQSVCEQLPKFVDSLPAGMKADLPTADLDVAATLAANANAFANGAKVSGVSFGAHYGEGVHPGVTCDKSGMRPIVGPRFHLKGHNYDLCEAEFNKLTPEEQAKFERIEPPMWQRKNPCPDKCAWREMKEAWKETKKEAKEAWKETKEAWKEAKEAWHQQGFHPNVTCDKSGMSPIVGVRYNLMGHNYDLCEAEFNKLSPDEQAKFQRIEPRVFGAPWKPRCWRPCPGPNAWGHAPQQDQRHGCQKLAARFVTDVSIFDGTQMPAGTRFTKIWRVKNAGESPWPAGTKVLFVGGDQMEAELSVPIDNGSKIVMPGEEVDVAVDMVAPKDLGRYLGYWRLVGPMGRRRFGQRFWCHIQVVDPTAAEQPHDPSAVEAEISQMMARTSPDDNDDDADEVEAEADVNGPKVEKLGNADKTAPASSSAASSCTTPSIVSGMSSLVSAATSSAVSVHADSVSGTVTPAEVELNKEADPSPSMEVAQPPEEEEKAPEVTMTVAERVTQKLEQMGFDTKTIALVVDKHKDQTAAEEDVLQLCTRDLVQLSDWDSMLDDLEEMGFGDRDRNKQLMVKHNGSVKRTVKDLVSDGA